MKRFILAIFVLVLSAFYAFGAKVVIGGTTFWFYIVDKNNVYLTSGRGKYKGDIVVPDRFVYQGVEYTVTGIGDSAFENCPSLTSVTIPNSVSYIGVRAFAGCSSLTSVAISDRVSYINMRAFRGCSSLKSVTIPHSVTKIVDAAFEGCKVMTEIKVHKDNKNYTSVDGVLYSKDKTRLIRCPQGRKGAFTIPGGVTVIGSDAFRGCSFLTSVTIPNSVTVLGRGAFFRCPLLTSVTIPRGVTSMGCGVFGYSKGIVEFKVHKKNKKYTSIDGIIYSKDKTELVSCPLGRKGAFVIPDHVTVIGKDAFYGCSFLTSVTIPHSVTKIGDAAFCDCSSLASVVIPNSVTSIGDYAFSDCTSFTSVVIPNSVTSIGGYAFENCSSLKFVTIPNSVTSIGFAPFERSDSIVEIKLDADNKRYTFENGTLYNKDKTQIIHCPGCTFWR